jgi:hypothetical protein
LKFGDGSSHWKAAGQSFEFLENEQCDLKWVAYSKEIFFLTNIILINCIAYLYKLKNLGVKNAIKKRSKIYLKMGSFINDCDGFAMMF